MSEPLSVDPPASGAGAGRTRNRFDRLEWAGAFGDLGTLIPFLAAYIVVLKVDPLGVLFAFGAAMVACGLVYRTPFPVQPMKAVGAIATAQAAQTLVITPQAVYVAAVATGLIWLVIGLTGTANRVAGLFGRPIVIGIVLGLGVGFMLEGIRLMSEGWVLGAVALAATLLLLENRAVPAMFLLLAGGAVVALVQQPDLVRQLGELRIAFALPTVALGGVTAQDLLVGVVFLALPQVPLTLGNAIIAITEENNRLFADRPVTEKRVAVSTGLMNTLGGILGAVPMCHGAGGLAGQVRFGARTGGAPIILGAVLLAVALLAASSVETLLQLFPRPLLGVMLFLAGAQLALGSCDFSKDKGERFVTLGTAAFAVWNVGAAFVFGVVALHLLRRGRIRL